ncbi:MAG: hypothetical protein QM811_30800 [Pirellulales bacterium]
MIACEAPPGPRTLPENNPHAAHDVHVYVGEAGKAAMLSGRGEYPVGTVILKEKLPATRPEPLRGNQPNAPAPAPVAAPQPELFTGMLKREKGFHPECGDWEFFVVDGAAKHMLAQGENRFVRRMPQRLQGDGFRHPGVFTAGEVIPQLRVVQGPSRGRAQPYRAFSRRGKPPPAHSELNAPRSSNSALTTRDNRYKLNTRPFLRRFSAPANQADLSGG